MTLTPYREDIEPNVKNKKEILLGIKKLSEILGKENVFVRYDPILINERYTLSYHEMAFLQLCKELHENVDHIILSFGSPTTFNNVKSTIKTNDRQRLSRNWPKVWRNCQKIFIISSIVF